MVENTKNNVCDTCGSGNGRCGQCGNMCGFGGASLLRWVLGILIIVWVFSIGVRFGELKAYLEQSGYGYKHMQFRTYPGPMMGGATWSQGEDKVFFTQGVPASVTVSSGVTNSN